MLLDPADLQRDLSRLEDIERASTRLVVQALLDFRSDAVDIFQHEADLAGDIGEDVTREALDRLGVSRIDQRLFGKMDYKRARYVFHPDYAVKQALFVDSKAEKVTGQRTATLQTSQFSMRVLQMRAAVATDVAGKLPPIVRVRDDSYITTTLFVKYNYQEHGALHELVSISVAALPNGLLQMKYNPTAEDTIWLVGRNAPSLGEEFRVRLSLPRLKAKARWRVQSIPMPPEPFEWDQ